MLDEPQVVHFQTFGFLILRQLFTPDEVKILNTEFTNQLEAVYRHAPFNGTKRHWVTMMGPETPFFASLLEDPRFYEPAEQLYGEDVFGTITDANRYVGDSAYHPDTGSLHQYGVKFAYYLDPVGPETGALRVIPGSHKDPFHSEVKENLGKSGVTTREVPAHVCTSEPGDVVAFDLRLWHGSCGGSNDRRMCTTVFYHNPQTPEEEAVTRHQARSNPGFLAYFDRPDDPLYDPHWIANPEGDPRRQRWIDRMRELEFFGPPEI
jgi:hypothetical protein